MRNLKLLYSRHKPPSPDLADCYHISVDPDSGNVILVTASRILALDPLASQVTHSRSLFCEELLQEGKGHIVNMHYLPEQHSACLATSKGNIVLWSLDVDELECMGSVESGFTNMNWSPDNELLVLTTGGNTVIIMTREFDPVTEMPLHPSEFGEGEFIALGWGKKETQFHGSEGKHAARRQKEDIQPAVTWDDQKPRICWRGDGQFFAVSCISPSSGARTIRVWSREGLLQSTSEPMSGLEQALFWRPSGSLITSSQRKPNKHNVVFFEKNGLQHGEFTLPFQVQEVQVMEIMWNIESTILAVWCEDLPPQGLVDKDSFKSQSHVLLWTCSNYHWAQKQSLIFGGSHGKVSAMTWDPEQAGRLHLMTSDGEYLQYTWTWSTNHSLGQTLHDSANVFVINGKTVCVTPMRQMVIPPPMSAYQLQLPSPVNMVVSPALPANATNAIAILTHDNQLFVYMPDVKKTSDDKEMTHSQGDGPQCTEPVLQTSYQVVLPDGVSEFPLCINHICWPQSDTLIFSIQNDKGALLCPSHLPSQTTPNILLLGTLIPVEDMVISLSTSIYSRSVAIQLANGVMLRYRFDDETLLPWETALGKELHMPYPCSQIEIVSFCGEEAVLGLTERFRFYVNGIEIASNCTSFAVHNNFVLLTTLNHTVRCIHRHTTVQDLPSLSDGKAHPFDESIRRVERGSRIVTVVAEDTKLVLQMPRGNLETIHPRALVLTTVRKFLDRCEFGSAFTIMKKHRINLNLLYDHNPLMFLRSVTDFIHQISSVTDLNLFLMELQEEDVTVIMYTAVYNRTPDAPASTTISDKHASKVDTVCDAVRSALEQEGVHRYLLSILTTYVKKSVPDLRKALEIVWEVKGSGMEEGGVGADEALKYLLLLVDVNRLYDAALATYNFDLVLMVAEKSQKDPKEYLPFLNQLRKLPDYYCRFTIDRHLKLYSSALKHISYCGPDHFSECIDLVQEHKLYAEALKLYATDSLEFKTLAREYGYYLREKNRHEEAGIAFLRAEYRRQAFDTFIECLNWRQAFCMTEQLQLDPSFIADTARKLAVRLKDNKRFSEAAIVYEHYAKDVEEAIVALIEGALWDEALRLMHLHQRTDIIETHLKTAINEACDQTMAMLENQHWEMEKHIKRLMDVRQEKEHRQQELWDQRDNINAELLSDTSSMTGESTAASHVTVDSNRSTVFSKASGRSGRNRRKADHKRWSLKEGSPYEECALMDAIAKIISATDGMREEVYALLRVLVQFHHIEQAEELQERYDNFLITIQRVIPQVWVLDNSEDNNTVLGPSMTANAIAQAMRKGQMPASVNRLDPVLSIPPVLKKNVRWKLHMLNTLEHKKL